LKRTFGERPEDTIPQKKKPISTGTRCSVDICHHYATQSDHDPGTQIQVTGFGFFKFNCSFFLSFLGVETPTSHLGRFADMVCLIVDSSRHTARPPEKLGTLTNGGQ